MPHRQDSLDKGYKIKNTMPNPCDLSIIIVNYNTRDYLARCLESLAGISGICTEIIVVDNASKDLITEMVKARFPEALLIANGENRGLAKANNQAIAVSR